MAPATLSPTSRIGWIGVGVMGAHMARHVMDAGYTLTVYNRTKAKAEALVAKGAAYADTPKAVGEGSDIVFTMVGFPSDVATVISDPEVGVLSGLKEGGIVVDLTTSEPNLAVKISEDAFRAGKFVLDAPVTGGDVGAKNGSLSVMVGGDRDAYNSVLPLLECFSNTVTYFGPAGSGQHCKVANQITIASSMIGLCEGLVYAHASGLDLNSYLAAVSGGGAGSKTMSLYAPRILRGDMEPGFFVEHFVKDLGIAVNACRELKISLPGLGLASQMYNSLMASGEHRSGTQALIRVLERMNNTKLRTAESEPDAKTCT